MDMARISTAGDTSRSHPRDISEDATSSTSSVFQQHAHCPPVQPSTVDGLADGFHMGNTAGSGFSITTPTPNIHTQRNPFFKKQYYAEERNPLSPSTSSMAFYSANNSANNHSNTPASTDMHPSNSFLHDLTHHNHNPTYSHPSILHGNNTAPHHTFPHHQSMANILTGNGSVRSSIASLSNNADPAHRSVDNDLSSVPIPQATMMGRSSSTPHQKQQSAQQQAAAAAATQRQRQRQQQDIQNQSVQSHVITSGHHNTISQSPPQSVTSNQTAATSVTMNAVKSSRRKLLSFTKKATKIAGDLAFGRNLDEGEYPFHPQLQRERFEHKQLHIEYHAKLKNVSNLFRDHSMSFYIDYLRFFLKYMDDSELDDPLTYSITRNTFWNNWYLKYLKQIDEILDSKLEGKLIKQEHTSIRANDRLSPLDDIKLKIANLPTIEQLDSELFQDRRIILILLWHNQIVNRLSNQSGIILRLLSKQAPNSELCIITSNRLKSFHASPNDALPKLLRNHISPSYFELIDGWKLRHDFPNFKTNIINISDRFQVLLDSSKTGYLPVDLLQQYPHFNDYSFLSSDFIKSKLKMNEKIFLSNYASFTAPSIQKLPLKDASQSLVYLPDFTRLISNVNDINAGLNEFNRILKPGGSAFFVLFDIQSFKHFKTASCQDHHVHLAEYIQIYINCEIAKFSKLPNLSQIIIQYLKEKNYKNIKFVKLGIPVLNYQEQQYDYEDSSKSTVDLNPTENSEQSTLKTKMKTQAPITEVSSAAAAAASATQNFNYNRNENLGNISDQPIASLYSMVSSYIDFLRIGQIFDLNGWITNPEEKLKLNDELIGVLKLWLSWKIHGFKSQLVRDMINERIQNKIDSEGRDTELGVKLITDSWDILKDKDSKRIDYYLDENYGIYNDGILAGLDSIFLLTADKDSSTNTATTTTTLATTHTTAILPTTTTTNTTATTTEKGEEQDKI